MQVTFIIETHSEDDFEITDFSLKAGDMTDEEVEYVIEQLKTTVNKV